MPFPEQVLCAGEHRSQRKHALVRSDRYCRGVSRPRWVLLKPDGLPTKADDGRRTSGSKYPCGAPQGSSVHVEGFAVVIVNTRLSTLTMISDAEGVSWFRRRKVADVTLETITSMRNLPFSDPRSEEHTSELQSLMRISYAVFCLKKNTKQ